MLHQKGLRGSDVSPSRAAIVAWRNAMKNQREKSRTIRRRLSKQSVCIFYIAEALERIAFLLRSFHALLLYLFFLAVRCCLGGIFGIDTFP